MFKDATGSISMMRVCIFSVIFTICVVYIAHNIVSMLHGHGLVSFGATEITALGLVFAAKVGQNITENAGIKSDDGIGQSSKIE